MILILISQRADSCLNTNGVNIPMHASTKVIRNRRINYHVKALETKSKPVIFTDIFYSAWSETVVCVVCLHHRFYSDPLWLKVGFRYHYVHERVKITKIRK
jgi:hypothetical protein